ncbi:ABC transporter substrate-binding protein [Burkholderia pseudomallei]|uniref:ABC transporter substrate-binding protein n=1 Tax=Burkholderia pseudomallei TaxID=28450 RepID=UPI000717DF0C|nr:ABC transporter substrate-binding protein [Burkholderia pseudomallei]ONA35498.1 branched-chain amino acid ABC transporter substrate-binding protein [Burkholderia pseudomallei]
MRKETKKPCRARCRRWFVAIGALGLMGWQGAAAAAPTLVVAGYGGSSETMFRTQVLAPFAQAHGVSITYVAGTSATNLARLQAQRAHSQIDVAVLDDGPMQQAVTMGLCQPLTPSPVYADLYGIATVNGEGKSVGIGIVATGLAYNTKVFAEQGWPTPTSWTALGDPRFHRRVLVPSISNTYGLQTLLAVARVEGGDAQHIDPGFAYMAQHVAPSVLSFETASGTISELFQTGAVVLGVWGSGRTLALARTGFPIAFVAPKEGAQALLTTACVVHGSAHAALAQALVQDLVSPRVQRILAAQAGWGPTNKTVTLDPAVAKTVVYGADAVAHLVPVDWKTVNAQRAAWTARWMREIER